MLSLKPNHKIIKDYYAALETFARHAVTHETAIKNAFQSVLTHCCRQMDLDFIEEYSLKRLERYNARIDGAFVDKLSAPYGYWEAKDSHDDLALEVRKKFDIGYPRDNIIFQAPERAIIYQGATLVLDEDITRPEMLVTVLMELFHYKSDVQLEWEGAVEEFKSRIPEWAELLIKLIEEERQGNRAFISSFEQFTEICRSALNPNLSMNAIEEMLVQHLLTERIFRKVFENPDFVNRNIIAHEIDKVITALTSRKFNRNDFLRPLDRFYTVLEKRAAEIDDYSVKQGFLNTVYEKFFQGFAVKVADTHGIVYTPQPIVDFMVNSVDEILKREFGRSLGSPGVHILDPFTGTGNFITNIMRKIKRTDLRHKYLNELHCNEIMLLPYYVASMNIEHQYYELTNEYLPFPGICLVDTFQIAEGEQISLFTEENSQRVEKLKRTPIFVYIGNPPYNAGQANENDNNKNRKYPHIDKRVSDTFGKDSKATNKNMLQDPYIKAFRLAMDKIIEKGEGIVAFVTNNSFIDGIALDGMRKHIYQNFDEVFIVDLKGNIRKDSMKDGIPLGEKHTIFGLGAMVGISITFLVKKNAQSNKRLIYSDVNFRSTRLEKFHFLNANGNIYNTPSKFLVPDSNNTWLTEGMQDDWESFIPLGTKESKAGLSNAIFGLYSRGIATCRDAWAYNFQSDTLANNISGLINEYNNDVIKYNMLTPKPDIDSFVNYENNKINWSEGLKKLLKAKHLIKYNNKNIRFSIYRPFCCQELYFDKDLNERRYQFPKIFPTPEAEKENLVIIVPSLGSSQIAFHISKIIVDLNYFAGSTPVQCFPFYTYNEDGSGRRENISDWGLKQFREHYRDESITKWDIFYYIYGALHKPEYRTKYSANLRRSLPRIPFYEDFRKYSEAGRRLAELHTGYEQQSVYPLTLIEAKDKPLDWKVSKMKLSKDRQTIMYNDFLTLTGIPLETWEYKLGNRSALDWIIDQYQVTTDKRSGIVNDPNREDEPDYIVRLIGKIVTVSIETVRIVNGL